MATFEDLYKHMIPKVGSCPKQFATHELHEAFEEFCDVSEAWVFKCDAMDVVANQADYVLDLDYDARIKRIECVWLDKKPQEPATYDLTGEKTLTFATNHVPVIALTAGLVVEVILVPRLTVNEFDDDFFERWGIRAVMALAMANILGMEGRPWYSESGAEKAQKKYDISLCEARMNKVRKNKGGDLRVTPRRFV